jgi:hypothetical protein
MELDVVLALEESRPVVAFEPDWRDVLDRADLRDDGARVGRRRRRVPLAACALLVAVVAAAGPALGLDETLRSFFDLSRPGHVAPAWRQAGPPVRPGRALLAAARLTHVDPGTLRRIGAAGSGDRRLLLIGGIGPGGGAWLGQTGAGWVSDFFPLFGDVGQVANRYTWRPTARGWQGTTFPMYARQNARRGVFDYVLYGGTAPRRTSWATLVGFARDDVVRVAVRTAAGARRWQPLTSSGGFSYVARSPALLPSRVEGFDRAGKLVAHERIDLRPYAG